MNHSFRTGQIIETDRHKAFYIPSTLDAKGNVELANTDVVRLKTIAIKGLGGFHFYPM